MASQVSNGTPGPKTLRKPLQGETIALVSPASPLAEEKLVFITNLLEEEGFAVRVMPHALENDYHLAGKDADRAKDLMDAFLDPSVGAVLCTRGGYGCARLFPYLDLDAIAATRKPFLGFSDITTLHLALNRRGMPTIHAPMALTLHYPREPWVIDSFRRVLRGDLTVPADAPVGQTLMPGQATGETVGGCLCLICDSIGTPNEIDTDGKIVVIEDVDEAPHRIDAMLTHLLNAGLLQKAAGIVIGEMTRTDERVDAGIGGWPWRRIITDRIAPLGIPTILEYPFGHAPNMLTLALGVEATLDAGAGTLVYARHLYGL